MRIPAFIFLLICTAAQVHAVRISAPDNGISHPRRDKWEQSADSPENDRGWEPNNTRRPRTGQSGWQFHPSNKWKAPRDAKAEKRRDYERRRRQNSASRLRPE